jgi:hypothetical protein
LRDRRSLFSARHPLAFADVFENGKTTITEASAKRGNTHGKRQIYIKTSLGIETKTATAELTPEENELLIFTKVSHHLRAVHI